MIPARVILVLGLSAVGLSVVSAAKCFSCSGEACVNAATLGNAVDCGDAVANCYSKFSGYKLTERGCSPADAANQCTGADCVRCAGDYCNQLGKEAHRCVTCSSVIDANCVSDPTSLAATQCGVATLDVTASQCYSKVVGSVTERGCVQRQEDLDNCVGPNCEMCSGAGCNNAEFPANRQKCVKCDGIQCNAISVTSYCDLPGDNCVTGQRADGTYFKNCESVISVADRQLCQNTASSCTFCGNQECNKAPINGGQKCYTCEGTACQQTSVDIESCHNVDDTCFSMFDGFNPVRRGCRSSLNEQDKLICDNALDASCSLCMGSVCNLVSREDHHCEYCSSVWDATCVAAPDHVVQCPAPSTEISVDAQCYTRVIGGVTERGCLGSTADALECQSSENCQMCAISEGAACNKEVFPANRIKCMVGTAADQYCPDPHDHCVQIFNNGGYTKKCQSSLSSAEVSFCEANSNRCMFCEGNNCNQPNIAFDYLECLSCQSSTDASCTVNPTAVTATAHCATCATLLSGTTLKRGCLETMSAAEKQQCTAGNQCATCTENRCNKAIFPADRLSCYTCLQGECFSHERITIEYCPSYVAGDSCVIQQDAAGKLLRMGCKSSLSSAEVSVCNTNPALCRTCYTGGCNDPVKHMSTGSCIQCDSATDGKCFYRADSFDAEPCNDPLTTKCYTRMVSGRVLRGCVSDLSSSDKTKCSSGQDCQQCDASTRKCNTDIYPADRLSCYTCLQGECFSHDRITLEYCPNYVTGDSCVIQQDAAGKLLRMGCKSSLSNAEVSTCSTNPALCRTCNTGGCNDPVKHTSTGSCIQCDSATDVNCFYRADSFDAEPCNDPLTTKCYTRMVSGRVIRGCVSDLSSSDKTKCSSGQDCQQCDASTRKCNTDIYPADRLSCYTCLQGECFSHDRITIEYCPNYVAGDSCVIQQDATGKLLRMGCKSSLSSAEVSACSANQALCRTCNTGGCNDPVKYMSSGSCVQCDSATDVKCIGRADSIDAEPCNDPLTTKCYTRMVSGQVFRGCVSDLSSSDKAKCSSGQDCQQCDASTRKCNTDIYPADRVACYTCLQPPCNSHESISLEYCPTYQANEQCVALKDASTGQLVRLGCKSSLSSTEQSKCTANPQICQRCSTTRCNDPVTFLGASSCVQCSSNTDPGCVGKASNFVVQPCANPLNTQCYSRLISGGVTERGCLSDLDSTSNTRCLRGSDCTVCSSRNKCNIYEYPSQIKCFQCDSTQNANCKNTQTYGAASYCKTYSAGNQCYTVVQKNNDTVRKCSTKTRAEECKGADRCEVCLFNGCNSRDSTTIMDAIIPTPEPHRSSANANFVHSFVGVLLVMMVMMMNV